MPRIAILAGTIVPALLLCAGTAQAADDFTCRASAARVTTGTPALTVEPVRANAPATPCTSQSAFSLEETTIGPAKAAVVAAFTSLDASGATATAFDARPTITLPGLVVEVQAAQASVTVPCGGGKTLAAVATSRVAGLTVNGTPVVVPAGDAPFTLPLGPLGEIVLNEQLADATNTIRRAVRITTPGAVVILAEAIGGSAGNPCAPSGTGAGDGAGAAAAAGGASGSPARPCPPGATYEQPSNLCVIDRPGKDRIVVGPPFSGPSGGTVMALDEARSKFSSACLKGSGPKFAIIGTKGRDRVTGTNRSDRILVLAGRDNVEGGRGDDCIDGGSGVDTLSGALGKDRIIGGTGGDHLIGGSAADLLEGGSGNDTIHSGFGADTVRGGSGTDKINAATAGPRSRRLDCGKGRDKIRINRNERRVVKGCERVYRIR